MLQNGMKGFDDLKKAIIVLIVVVGLVMALVGKYLL